eukprot:3867740-Pyramimonas_sp.AAC.1
MRLQRGVAVVDSVAPGHWRLDAPALLPCGAGGLCAGRPRALSCQRHLTLYLALPSFGVAPLAA